MVKKYIISLGLLLLILIIVFIGTTQYRYENAIGVCENIGNRKSFLPKLEEAEDNKTMAKLLFIYYAHKCIDLSEEEKKQIKTLKR